MPIDDLLSYFDRWNGLPAAPGHNLEFDDCGVSGSYRGLRLYSVFQALFAADTLRPVAHEALLRARDEANRAVPPAEAFKRAVTPEDAVYFDRLCRMVHALNFFNQSGAEGELFLNVSGRHLLSVGGGGHGRTFETLLQHCGLRPTQIVLEILESRVDDLQHLQEAIDAYRSRGFRVAIDDFGCQHSNFDRLWQLTPDIVKLDRSLIVQAVANPRARRILPKLIEIIHDLGAQAVVEGIETLEQHALACDAGADLLQGYYYAKPSAEVVSRPVALVSSFVRAAPVAA
ncbi:MAG: EAL domain-containing protein [Candidatus Accumulibacter sp.]|jgi:EAL domain-containing protein (putative c-di-GMP-specific phosphodiesterase class I)|nr:EAL domain-containing protein [Accumulibacter sp.]